MTLSSKIRLLCMFAAVTFLTASHLVRVRVRVRVRANPNPTPNANPDPKPNPKPNPNPNPNPNQDPAVLAQSYPLQDGYVQDGHYELPAGWISGINPESGVRVRVRVS